MENTNDALTLGSDKSADIHVLSSVDPICFRDLDDFSRQINLALSTCSYKLNIETYK